MTNSIKCMKTLLMPGLGNRINKFHIKLALAVISAVINKIINDICIEGVAFAAECVVVCVEAIEPEAFAMVVFAGETKAGVGVGITDCTLGAGAAVCVGAVWAEASVSA